MARRKWYSTEKGATATAGLNSARLCWCLEDSENAALLRWLLGENGTVARILEERGAVTQLYYYVGGERRQEGCWDNDGRLKIRLLRD